jgi:hypothetical protein
MKYKSVKEMKEHLYKRTLLDEIKYYCFYAPIGWLDMSWRRAYWFLQRGYRGYGDNDTWDFDNYLANVIIGGLRELKRYYHGKEPTKGELNIIIKGFEENIKMMNLDYKYKSKKYLLAELKFKKAMKLLTKYFNYLWD